ncbi:OprD family porin [Flavihumibacter sp. RY-1]|uniref:OprD family porin n=1 Tax=Flavihumibacter fluminis TaxID=2909236 RepID=A0ABS9BFY9_9BACT|nr:OprD family outer membrane porin [Flavihumibacter fluminis]MCF1714466.1 OprD family porin [Flavihumibacter fluminis]
MLITEMLPLFFQLCTTIMNRILIILLVQLTLISAASAQNLPEPETTRDTSSLLHVFKSGTINGHARLFTMATDNATGIRDYAATAIGGGLRYKTGSFHGFTLGIGGYFIYDLASSNLAKPDPLTNAANRYEIGLFDIQDVSNKNDINRLEELYLQYKHKTFKATIGKQLPDMPFINQQDGRMRATGIDGLQLHWKPGKNTALQAAYLWQISPRSTVRWFSIGESIGIYPAGLGPDGKPSNYKDALKSKGVVVTSIQQQIHPNLSIQVWNQFVENIFNTAMVQAELRKPVGNKNTLTGGLQVIRQDAINDGGNEDPSKTYFTKGGKSLVLGGSIGLEHQPWNISLNYTRITKDGRYLMPREWGKDPFYTFLQRERNDGYADVNAIAFKANYKLDKLHSKLFLGYGHYYLPDVENAAFNKYATPSYQQLNLSWKYDFQAFLKGMDIQFLFVHKSVLGDESYAAKYLVNKVNMSNYNLILNYTF